MFSSFFKKRKVDKVKTFDDAVNYLIKNFNNKNFSNPYWHHNDGRKLRNDLNLWNRDTPLCLFMKNKYNITHPDDISGLILNAAKSKLNSINFDLAKEAKFYSDYWDKISNNVKIRNPIL